MDSLMEILGVAVLASIVYGQVGTLCRSNERLLACGGCQATCRVPHPACSAVCRMGCYCPPGHLRNDTGHCVPLADCPYTSIAYQEDTSEPRAKDEVCPQNEEYLFCGTCHRTCDRPDPVCPAQCSRGCYCKEGLLRDSSGRCVEPQHCHKSATAPLEVSCPANEEFRPCEPCSPTCANPSPVCPAQCARGCFCKEGLLRDWRGRCVLPHQCQDSDTSNYIESSLESDPVCGERQVYKRCACERTCLERHGTCDGCTSGCFCADGWVRGRDGGCIEEHECPKDKCPDPDEVYECRSSCEEGCDGDEGCTGRGRSCVLGCYCKTGLIRNFRTGQCVVREQCTNVTVTEN